MNNIKHAFILFVALLLTAYPLYSQDKRTLDTKIADLLMQVPADDQDQLNQQMNQMLELGEAGLQKVLDMIIPPGTGDDTNPRVAVESLSRYLSQQGKENEKKSWEAILLEEIRSRNDFYVRSFLMSQLNYIGGDATIKSLSKYLTDTILHDPAIRAMRDANPEDAAKIFVDHLNKTYGNTQIALVNAIGELGFMDHASAVAHITGSNDPLLQRSVLACLAKLGHPEDYKLMSDAAESAGYLPESTNATGSLLAYAQTLSENNNPSLSLKICKLVEKRCKGPEQVHFRIRALTIKAGGDQIENTVPILVDALKSENKQYRMAAINFAAKNRSPVAPWVTALNSSKNSEVKSEILYLLGQLAVESTPDAVRDHMNHDDAMVRQQAVKSLVLIEKDGAIKDIINYLLAYPSHPDTETAKAALLQAAGNEHVKLLIQVLQDAPDKAKIVVLEVIAEKGNSDHFKVLFDQIAQGGPVGSSALAHLYRVSSYDHLNELMILFDRLEEDDERLHIEKALVVSMNQSENKSEATRSLMSFVTENSTIQKYIGVLAGVGGEDAMRSVYTAYTEGDDDTKKAAFGALVNSNDIFAAKALFEICSGENSADEKTQAFRSYVRIVSRSSEPDDQKLLLLRKIEPFAPGTEATIQVIGAMGNVKTFLSFLTLSKYLDDDELKSEAANALVRVVLPSGGMDNGLSGNMVKENLIRAQGIVTGPDSEYLKIDITNYLNEMPDRVGFVSMFNGKDLSGWQGLATDPLQKKKLSEEELEKLQDQANEKVKENWSIKDHSIVFNGKGANLCSVREYGSFEMIVDWRITKKGDSGIYLRGSPQVQIWDTSRVEDGAQVGSGGLYNNQKHESEPLVVADNPVGDWNTFHITMVDERVTVYLNGQLVVDSIVMENYWDRSIPIFPTGSIELQAHGTDLAFRDIYVREIKSSGNKLTQEEKAGGFVSLFNGTDLSGWTGVSRSYSVEDGTIVIHPQEGGRNLYTENEYADFIFRFEFKLTPGANNGLGIRTPLEGDAAYVGYELQILDNTALVYAELEPYQYHGSVYGIIPAKRGFLKPVGEWNSQEVMIKGDDIKITLNGTAIVDGNIKEAAKNGTPDGKEHPGLKRTNGHIGFLGHGSLLWFRNIRIKEL